MSRVVGYGPRRRVVFNAATGWHEVRTLSTDVLVSRHKTKTTALRMAQKASQR